VDITLTLCLIIVILLVIKIYNKLIRLRNICRNSFSQIDVQLKRRHDLIPNLVEVTKGYMKYERETFEAVIKARNEATSAIKELNSKRLLSANAMAGVAGAESNLNNALSQLFALVEGYPELKANEAMQNLMEDLRSTENRIAFARQVYNDAVMNYNTRCELFPHFFVAKLFNFSTAPLFELDNESERAAINLTFS
jgi:LemA protein